MPISLTIWAVRMFKIHSTKVRSVKVINNPNLIFQYFSLRKHKFHLDFTLFIYELHMIFYFLKYVLLICLYLLTLEVGHATASAGTGGKSYQATVQSYLKSARSGAGNGSGSKIVGTPLICRNSHHWAWETGSRVGLAGQEVASTCMSVGGMNIGINLTELGSSTH